MILSLLVSVLSTLFKLLEFDFVFSLSALDQFDGHGNADVQECGIKANVEVFVCKFLHLIGTWGMQKQVVFGLFLPRIEVFVFDAGRSNLVCL